MTEVLTESQAAKTRSEHDDMNRFVPIHALNLGQGHLNAIARKQYSPQVDTKFCSIPRPDSVRLGVMNIPSIARRCYLKRFKFGGTIMIKAYLCIP
jgi:hypothetical protein